MNRRNTIKALAVLLLPLAAMNVVAAVNFPLGTHLIKGTSTASAT